MTGNSIMKRWRQAGLISAMVVLVALLTPGLALAADLVVDGGDTLDVPPDITFDYETIGDTGQGTLNQTGGTNTLFIPGPPPHTGTIILGNFPSGSGTYNLSAGSLSAAEEVLGSQGTGTLNQSGGTNFVADFLILGRLNGARGTYKLSGSGSLSADNLLIIGAGGTGTFTQTGGSNTISLALILGEKSGSSGTYNLSGGSLWAPREFIGRKGNGAFTQTGGTHTVYDATGLVVGSQFFSNSTYDLSGGSLSARTEDIGSQGTGTFTQSGGTNTTGNLKLAIASDSSGTYNLSNGSLSASHEFIGHRGTGAFIHTGGTNTIGPGFPGLNLGSDYAGKGTYLLSGSGSLSAHSEVIGGLGTGAFTQTGGTNSVGELRVNSSGTYDLKTGSLSATTEVIGRSGLGTFTQSGGTNSVSESLLLGFRSGIGDSFGIGNYELSAGSLEAAKEIIGEGGTGTFTQSGGTNMVAQGLELGVFDLGSGTYNLSGTGSLSVGNDLIVGDDGAGTFTQTGGTNAVANDLIIAAAPGSTGLYNFLGGSLSATNLMVNPGGTFKGAGTLSAAFTNNGLVQPGTSAGALNIVGSYTQDPTGTLEIEIESPTRFDQLNVTGTPGTADLAGTLTPVFVGGHKPLGSLVFPVLTATGGVSGAFNPQDNLIVTPILKWDIRYTPTSVELLFSRDYTNRSLGLCPNQWQVGNMLNSVAATATGDLENVLNVIDFLPTAGAVREAYKQISPEKAVPLPDLGFAAAVLQQRSLARRITDLRFGAREMNFARGFPGSLNILGSRGSGGIMLAYNGAGLAGMVPAMKEPAPGKRWGVFLDPAVIIGNRGSSNSQTGYDYTLAGFTLGVDCRVRRNFLVGLATGYSHNNAGFRGSGGKVTNNTWPLTAYAAYLPEKGYAFASLGYSLNLFDLKRHISFGGLSRRARSSTPPATSSTRMLRRAMT